MTLQKPIIKNCPFCRIAMVGSRSKPGRPEFYTFHCLQCDTVIHLDAPPADSEPRRDRG
jgi:hypothetical protein